MREIFPAAEASWRFPVTFAGALGMAAGGWLAGVIHDAYGFAPAFLAGIAFNVVNLLLIGVLVPRHATPRQVNFTPSVG